MFIMDKKLKKECDELEQVITNTYTEGVTIEDAEKLAARFLGAQLKVANELSKADLDSRMKKSGLKTIKASTYLDAATQGEKKPSDTLLNNVVETNELVLASQKEFDESDVNTEMLKNYMSIFKESHIYFRGIAKGKFD